MYHWIVRERCSDVDAGYETNSLSSTEALLLVALCCEDGGRLKLKMHSSAAVREEASETMNGYFIAR